MLSFSHFHFLQNVAYGKVESREFLDPCKAVSTLQIARDLRNDAPVQLSSVLTNLDKDILETLEEDKPDLNVATIRDYSIRIPSKLLDLDMEEEIQTIQTFQDIVKKQMTAREKLIYLLLKSRCQFGSQQAAEELFAMKETSQKLKRRRQLLGDALELEGMDSEINNTDFESQLQDLPALSWYRPAGKAEDKEETPTTNKKARTES
jgi:hypothetical protein